MKITAKLEGAEKVSEMLKSLDAEAKIKVQQVIDSSAQNIRNHAIRSIQNSPATGRTYKRGAVSHTASSEGNPPKTDTGGLVRSISASVGDLVAEIGAYINYAVHLEFGTRNMGARPFMQPAMEQERKNFFSKMNKALNEAILRARK